MCGLDEAAKKDLVKGPAQGGSHLHNLLKFLTVRSEKEGSRTGITLLGGPVDTAADGDPSRCPSDPFRPTAARGNWLQQWGIGMWGCEDRWWVLGGLTG